MFNLKILVHTEKTNNLNTTSHVQNPNHNFWFGSYSIRKTFLFYKITLESVKGSWSWKLQHKNLDTHTNSMITKHRACGVTKTHRYIQHKKKKFTNRKIWVISFIFFAKFLQGNFHNIKIWVIPYNESHPSCLAVITPCTKIRVSTAICKPRKTRL